MSFTVHAQTSEDSLQQPGHLRMKQLQNENEQLQQALASLQQELQRLFDLSTRCPRICSIFLSKDHFTPRRHALLTLRHHCRAGQSGDSAARQALSPRRTAFKSLLKKGAAAGKENNGGQTESFDTTKLQQQLQLQSQTLCDVAAAVGVTPGAEGSSLRVLCLQVRAVGSCGCSARF